MPQAGSFTIAVIADAAIEQAAPEMPSDSAELRAHVSLLQLESRIGSAAFSAVKVRHLRVWGTENATT